MPPDQLREEVSLSNKREKSVKYTRDDIVHFNFVFFHSSPSDRKAPNRIIAGAIIVAYS